MAGVSPAQVWAALEAAGASAVQAAGIMGNWIAESGLNPEAAAMDTNSHMSYGIAQWNTASYPAAGSLVTGNPAADLAAQVRYFAQTGGINAAKGSTPQQAAASVAAGYERCAGCQAGGAQNARRQANAAMVAGWASSGKWPASAGSASDTAALTAAGQAQASASCAWQLGGGSLFGAVSLPSVCLLSKSQARALLGAGIMAGGLVILGAGAGFTLAATAIRSPALGALLAVVPAGKAAGAALKAGSGTAGNRGAPGAG